MTRARLRDLQPGTRFRYDYGRVAVLDTLGPSGARIRYEGAGRDVSFSTEDGGEVAFTAPGRLVVVSDDSLVTVLES